jgi:hypothetical protein
MMKAFRESNRYVETFLVESWMEHLPALTVRLKKWLGHFTSVTNRQKFLACSYQLLRR